MVKATKQKTLEVVTATNPILNPAFIAYWMKRRDNLVSSLHPVYLVSSTDPLHQAPLEKFSDGALCGGSGDKTGDN